MANNVFFSGLGIAAVSVFLFSEDLDPLKERITNVISRTFTQTCSLASSATTFLVGDDEESQAENTLLDMPPRIHTEKPSSDAERTSTDQKATTAVLHAKTTQVEEPKYNARLTRSKSVPQRISAIATQNISSKQVNSKKTPSAPDVIPAISKSMTPVVSTQPSVKFTESQPSDNPNALGFECVIFGTNGPRKGSLKIPPKERHKLYLQELEGRRIEQEKARIAIKLSRGFITPERASMLLEKIPYNRSLA